MDFTSVKKSSWPRQAAIVISDSPNVHMLLRELLRSYSWTVVDSIATPEQALAAVRAGQVFLIIVDDSVAAPAVMHVRYLLSDTSSLLTPVLSFVLDAHKNESASILRMGAPQVVEKPLTPSKFIPGFVKLVRTWENEPFLSLRRANYLLLAGHESRALRILLKLVQNDATRSLCSQALALHLRKIGKIKEAETALLSTLKKTPRDLGTMIALADLYMHAAMPRLAYRLLNGAKNAFGQSLCMLPDLVQAALLQGGIETAIEHLYEMQKKGFLEDNIVWILARLLFSEGREQEAERVLNNNKLSFKKLQAGWGAAELAPVNAVG